LLFTNFHRNTLTRTRQRDETNRRVSDLFQYFPS
jgi:hypothetical protein